MELPPNVNPTVNSRPTYRPNVPHLQFPPNLPPQHRMPACNSHSIYRRTSNPCPIYRRDIPTTPTHRTTEIQIPSSHPKSIAIAYLCTTPVQRGMPTPNVPLEHTIHPLKRAAQPTCNSRLLFAREALAACRPDPCTVFRGPL